MADPPTYVRTYLPYAQKWEQRLGIPASVLLAIGASESNWGATGTLFGIKGQGTAGSQNYATWEMVNGQPVQTRADFAAYNNPDEAFQHFANLVSQGRYAPAFQQLQQSGDWQGFLRGINQAGYATDPQWANKITSLSQTVGDLVGQQPQPPQFAPDNLQLTGVTPPPPPPGGAMDKDTIANQRYGVGYAQLNDFQRFIVDEEVKSAPKPQGPLTRAQLEQAGYTFSEGYAYKGQEIYRLNADMTYDPVRYDAPDTPDATPNAPSIRYDKDGLAYEWSAEARDFVRSPRWDGSRTATQPGAPKVATRYITQANGDQKVYDADLLNSNPAIGEGAWMYTLRKGGGTPIVNPGYKGAQARAQQALTEVPGMGGTSSSSVPGLPSIPTIGTGRNYPFETAAGTTSFTSYDPKTDTSRGESGGYLTGPAAITGRANPVSIKTEKKDTEEASNQEYKDALAAATAAGLTSVRSSSKTPGVMTFYDASGGQGLRTSSRRSPDEEEESTKVSGVRLFGRGGTAAVNDSPYQSPMGRRRPLVLTNRPATLVDNATRRPLAMISERGNRVFPQPEVSDFSVPGRMHVTPMEDGGDVISGNRPTLPKLHGRGPRGPYDDEGNPYVPPVEPPPAVEPPPVVPVTPPTQGGLSFPAGMPEFQASFLYGQEQQRRQAEDYRDQLARIGRVDLPVPLAQIMGNMPATGEPIGNSGKFRDPEIPRTEQPQFNFSDLQAPAGFRFALPDLGREIINMQNQLAMMPQQAENEQARRSLSSGISYLRSILPKFYPSILPSAVEEATPLGRNRPNRVRLGDGL